MADSSDNPWVPPAHIEELYSKADGNRFASINRPTAGARHTSELPTGEAPIQLYSFRTPNGQKVSVILEELGLKYDAFPINIMKGDQFGSGFVDVNPNSKIPAIVDRDGPEGKSVRVFESGSILLYLADKYGKFVPPQGTAARVECVSWLMWNMGGMGPMFGNFGHFFRYAPRNKHEAIDYGVARYGMEAQRLLSVLNAQLEGRQYIIGDEYTIADVACYPWVSCLITGYGAESFLNLDTYANVRRWMKDIAERPAVVKGMNVLAS